MDFQNPHSKRGFNFNSSVCLPCYIAMAKNAFSILAQYNHSNQGHKVFSWLIRDWIQVFFTIRTILKAYLCFKLQHTWNVCISQVKMHLNWAATHTSYHFTFHTRFSCAEGRVESNGRRSQNMSRSSTAFDSFTTSTPRRDHVSSEMQSRYSILVDL